MNWDEWFLGLARYISTASKDPSTKVGAVVVDQDRRIVSAGYNGLPRGVEDTEDRLANREVKYKLILHAERNALLFAKQSLKGCCIYVWPMMPCGACASMIIQTGITRVGRRSTTTRGGSRTSPSHVSSSLRPASSLSSSPLRGHLRLADSNPATISSGRSSVQHGFLGSSDLGQLVTTKHGPQSHPSSLCFCTRMKS